MRNKKLQAVAIAVALTIFLSQAMTVQVWAKDWGLGFNKQGEKPVGNESPEALQQYDAYFIGSSEEKVLYLTFDAGYENGYTETILDVLQKHKAPATFFLVGNYIRDNTDLIKRMVKDGHVVANHTMKHPDMTGITSVVKFQEQLKPVEEIYQSVTGEEMKKYYRPPQGKYSDENLKMAQQMGYKTILWSLAYKDYDDKNQPSKQDAFARLIDRAHPGAVILLHNTSKTNSVILDELLTRYEEMGYVFKPLEHLVMDLSQNPE